MKEIDFYLTTWFFAKKKYPESWDKNVLQAARDYIQYDEIWGDE